MSEHDITVQEASLKTATVEIKTIQVGNKQMTLAVFRQLENESAFGLVRIHMPEWYFRVWREVCEQNIWGYVNYHSSIGCDLLHGQEPPEDWHRHVIWNDDGRLRRWLVDYETLHSLAEELLQSPQAEIGEAINMGLYLSEDRKAPGWQKTANDLVVYFLWPYFDQLDQLFIAV